MKVIKDSSLFSRLTVLALSITLLTAPTSLVFATGTSAVSGEITVTGPAVPGEKPFVLVDGSPAITGRTFLSNGTINTPESSSAVIDFGKVGRISLGPASTLTLDVSANGIFGTLSAGSVRVSTGAGVAVKIDTPGDTVTNEATRASLFTVNVAAGATNVSAEKGIVSFNGGNSVLQAQDDDDDDDGNIWVPVIVIGGAIGAYFLYEALNDDDEVVSPLR